MPQQPNDALCKDSLEFMNLLYNAKGDEMFLDLYKHIEQLLISNDRYKIGQENISLFFPRREGFSLKQENLDEASRSICTMLAISFCGDSLLQHPLVKGVDIYSHGMTVSGKFPWLYPHCKGYEGENFTLMVGGGKVLEDNTFFSFFSTEDQTFFEKYISVYQKFSGEIGFLIPQEHPEILGRKYEASEKSSYLVNFKAYYIFADEVLNYIQREALKIALPDKPSVMKRGM